MCVGAAGAAGRVVQLPNSSSSSSSGAHKTLARKLHLQFQSNNYHRFCVCGCALYAVVRFALLYLCSPHSPLCTALRLYIFLLYYSPHTRTHHTYTHATTNIGVRSVSKIIFHPSQPPSQPPPAPPLRTCVVQLRLHTRTYAQLTTERTTTHVRPRACAVRSNSHKTIFLLFTCAVASRPRGRIT